jgi:hypothetical protein
VSALANLVTSATRIACAWDGDREVFPGPACTRGRPPPGQISVETARHGRPHLGCLALLQRGDAPARQIIANLPGIRGLEISALAGKEKLIVAGHDPLVADRFQQVGPIIKIA